VSPSKGRAGGWRVPGILQSRIYHHSQFPRIRLDATIFSATIFKDAELFALLSHYLSKHLLIFSNLRRASFPRFCGSLLLVYPYNFYSHRTALASRASALYAFSKSNNGHHKAPISRLRLFHAYYYYFFFFINIYAHRFGNEDSDSELVNEDNIAVSISQGGMEAMSRGGFFANIRKLLSHCGNGNAVRCTKRSNQR